MISKILRILGLQPRISKVFYGSLEYFLLTVGQDNFGNKILFLNFFLFTAPTFKESNDFWDFKIIFYYMNKQTKFYYFVMHESFSGLKIVNKKAKNITTCENSNCQVSANHKNKYAKMHFLQKMPLYC